MRKAFSLVELLTILAIITVLTGILAPVFRSARRGTQVTSAESQLHQMELTIELYRQNSEGAESGTGVQMGYPPSENPVASVWDASLLRSPCGLHQDYVDDAKVNFTYEFSPYSATWSAYQGALGSNAALIRDSQCDDYDHTLANPFVTHLGIAVRMDGSLWRQRARGNLLTLKFWGLPGNLKEGHE